MWENIAKYNLLFWLSTVKYFGAPLVGWAIDLTFLEISFSCFAGAYVCFNVFYWASSYFFTRAERKRQENPNKKKKVFSRKKRIIVRLTRHKYGYYWICFLCPMFLSIPGGTLVVAKFYSDRKGTFLITSFFIFLWSFILTAAYMFAG